MATGTESKPKKILTTTVTSDGVAKVSLVKREFDKLDAAWDLCDLIAKVPELSHDAETARDAVGELMDKLADA